MKTLEMMAPVIGWFWRDIVNGLITIAVISVVGVVILYAAFKLVAALRRS